MYAILNPQFALRSWTGRPCAVIQRDHVVPRRIAMPDFLLLRQCDGSRDLPETDRLRRLISDGICVPCAPGSALSEWQKLKIYDNQCVPSVYLMITGRCNLNCMHCFNASDNNARADQFSLDALEKLTDEAVACGVQSFWLTGGEPMLHPDFFTLVRRIREKDMFVEVLVTNGMYLTDSALDRLREEGFRGRIMISFDGVGYHDTMRRHPGAEKIVLDVIRRVVGRGIDLLINMNVNHGNRARAAESLDLLDSLGVPAVRLIRTVGTPRWEMYGGSDAMSPKEYYDFSLDCMEKYMSAPHRMDVQFREFASVYPETREYGIHPVIFEDDAYRPEALSCGIARRRIAVTASGEILPCMQAAGKMEEMHMSMGNYFRDGLKPHLTDSRYLDFVSIPVSSRHGDNDACRSCPWFRQCLGGCRLQAKLYTGSFYGPDPTRCEFFKNGFRQKIIDLGDSLGWKRVLRGE